MARHWIFVLGWTLLTLFCGVAFLPALISQRCSWGAARLWVALSLAWLRLSTGIRSEVVGAEYCPSAGGLIAAKHQSTLDTLVLWRVLKNPAFVLKRELYYIPIFGWYLYRTGQLGIDRSAGRAALASITARAGHVLAQGRSIIIFPEGTRVPAGQLKPFHSGVARISAQLQLPVTPVALNHGRFWPKRGGKKPTAAGDSGAHQPA